MEKNAVEIIRNLAKESQGRTVSLPVEMVDIIEGKTTEKSWKNIEISKVLDYIASMMEE